MKAAHPALPGILPYRRQFEKPSKIWIAHAASAGCCRAAAPRSASPPFGGMLAGMAGELPSSAFIGRPDELRRW
jgi:hypothetical protein